MSLKSKSNEGRYTFDKTQRDNSNERRRYVCLKDPSMRVTACANAQTPLRDRQHMAWPAPPTPTPTRMAIIELLGRGVPTRDGKGRDGRSPAWLSAGGHPVGKALLETLSHSGWIHGIMDLAPTAVLAGSGQEAKGTGELCVVPHRTAPEGTSAPCSSRMVKCRGRVRVDILIDKRRASWELCAFSGQVARRGGGAGKGGRHAGGGGGVGWGPRGSRRYPEAARVRLSDVEWRKIRLHMYTVRN